jgi:hypothetical protein
MSKLDLVVEPDGESDYRDGSRKARKHKVKTKVLATLLVCK